MSDNENLVQKSTDSLIEGLATQAGKRQAGQVSFSRALPLALLVSILAAAGMVLLIAGARSDLMAILPTWVFQFKAIGMVMIAVGAVQLTQAVVRPGAALHPFLCLGPGAVFMLGGALSDHSGFPLLGPHDLSAPDCAGIIILSSLPALAAILAVIRRGTPTRLRCAGAVAGALAGSIGALAYTIACLNDGEAFVALWYSAAIAAVSIIGAVAGPKALAW